MSPQPLQAEHETFLLRKISPFEAIILRMAGSSVPGLSGCFVWVIGGVMGSLVGDGARYVGDRVLMGEWWRGDLPRVRLLLNTNKS